MVKKNSQLPFIMLFWAVIAMGIGGLMWIVRILLIIQREGNYIANEPDSLILWSEIVLLTIGIFLSIFVLINVSKLLLERMM